MRAYNLNASVRRARLADVVKQMVADKTLRQRAQTVPALLLTGLPSSGKTTLGTAVVERLRELGLLAELVDGDELRNRLPPQLGFSTKDREDQANRAAFIAELLAANGVIPVIALVAPYARSREALRLKFVEGFFEIYLAPSLEVSRERDSRGIYGEIERSGGNTNTEVVMPYEVPRQPDLKLDTGESDLLACSEKVLELVVGHGLFDGGAVPQE